MSRFQKREFGAQTENVVPPSHAMLKANQQYEYLVKIFPLHFSAYSFFKKESKIYFTFIFIHISLPNIIVYRWWGLFKELLIVF